MAESRFIVSWKQELFSELNIHEYFENKKENIFKYRDRNLCVGHREFPIMTSIQACNDQNKKKKTTVRLQGKTSRHFEKLRLIMGVGKERKITGARKRKVLKMGYCPQISATLVWAKEQKITKFSGGEIQDKKMEESS